MPASQPRVIAIVVNHNGRAFLRDTFRGLAAQTRPIDDVLVVDTGSTDGSADWARSRLGDDAVMAVRGQFGRAVMSALRDQRTSGMDWLWLLHDDCAPEPEALERLLAEAESRPSASILGPKLVSWTNPDRLSGDRLLDRPDGPGGVARSRTTRSTRASTTRSATCSSSTPPACWSAAAPC